MGGGSLEHDTRKDRIESCRPMVGIPGEEKGVSCVEVAVAGSGGEGSDWNEES